MPIYWVHGVEDPLCKVKWARATVRLLTDRAHVSGGSRVRGDTMCTRFRFEEVDHPVQPSHGEVTLLDGAELASWRLGSAVVSRFGGASVRTRLCALGFSHLLL